MKILPGLKRFAVRFNPLLCIMGGAFTLYLGRVAALYVLARGFAQINLNADTYAVAPGWLRFLADHSDKLASIVGLILASCAVVLIKSGDSPFGKTRVKQFMLLLCGFAVGAGLIWVLRLLDEIRFLPHAYFVNWVDCVLWLCLSIFAALWLRGAFDAKANLYLALAVSMALQALFAWYLLGAFDPLLTVNALLFGFVGVKSYRKTGSVLPEILLFYGYTLGHRLLSGYPAGQGYYMSANLWNGGNAGLFASVFTTAILMLLAAVFILSEKKEVAHVKKPSDDREPLRGAKKGG